MTHNPLFLLASWAFASFSFAATPPDNAPTRVIQKITLDSDDATIQAAVDQLIQDNGLREQKEQGANFALPEVTKSKQGLEIKLGGSFFGESPLHDISALKHVSASSIDLSFTQVTDLTVLSDMPLKTVILSSRPGQKIDLRPLDGLPITHLQLDGRTVDLEQVATLKLTKLICVESIVRNLKSLEGMPLKALVMRHCVVDDLNGLKGLPLEALDISGTQDNDYSVLKELPLSTLRISKDVDRNKIRFLENSKTLTHINKQPLAEFFKESPKP